MKRIHKYMSVVALTLLIMVLSNNRLYAQEPADPSIDGASSSNGASTGVVGGGASVDGGMNLFLLFAVLYGTKRIYSARRKQEEETPVVINE